MTTLSELCVCKLCGNVFSERWCNYGTSCLQCKGTSFNTVDINKELLEDIFDTIQQINPF